MRTYKKNWSAKQLVVNFNQKQWRQDLASYIANKLNWIDVRVTRSKYVEEDNTYVYQIELKENLVDDKEFRKNFAIKCAENNILNLGITKEEASLEDAFIKLIENRQEFTNKEINKMQYQRELEDLRKEKQEKKERKEYIKEKREELKEQKKLEKQNKKEENKEDNKEENNDDEKGGEE